MESKRLKRTAYLAIVWLIVLAAILITATYAWFTFNPYTNVTPMSSTVSKGGASLLIANQKDGKFDKECVLNPESGTTVLSPVSSADLTKFFEATAQNREGISILFHDVSQKVNDYTIHGKVYLKCENEDCDVYLRRFGINVGKDGQTLAALRMGMNVSTSSGTHNYIMKLDAMGDTANAAKKRTIATDNSVVSAIDKNGNASFEKDPAVEISQFFAKENGTDDPEPEAGEQVFCRLKAGEIATVEYWLYLEGCDINCINEVQKKDIALQLSFAGVAQQ